MTNEQINAAIAEACGWTDIENHCDFGLMGIDPSTHGLRTCVPYYASDLNAMHEAEQTLGVDEVSEYTNNLYDMACEIQKKTGKWNPYGLKARQRAEAFLKTIGKWEEAG